VSSPIPIAHRTDLLARLLALGEEFRAEGGIDCEVTEVVFRTVRELLTNVRQHARAKLVRISSVDRRDGSIGIIVTDDGVGLPPERRRGNPFDDTGRIGLWSIDQRLRDFGAVLDIEAESGRGTRAMVVLPGRLVVAQ
jgi:signal transduction histidine kinase